MFCLIKGLSAGKDFPFLYQHCSGGQSGAEGWLAHLVSHPRLLVEIFRKLKCQGEIGWNAVLLKCEEKEDEQQKEGVPSQDNTDQVVCKYLWRRGRTHATNRRKV